MADIGIKDPASSNSVYKALISLRPYDTGWGFCRLGGEEDGAYLIPTCLEGIERCFSPGVCNLISFEEDLARIFEIPSSTCDPEDTSLPAGAHKLISFERFKIGSENSADSLTLKDWIKKTTELREASLILSMDIEGVEYEVIQTAPDEVMNSFRIITLEIHALHMLWDKQFLEYFKATISKLSKYHDIVHLHPNNGTSYNIKNIDCEFYTCLELTLLHKSFRLKPPILKTAIKHRLDIDNVKAKNSAKYKFIEDNTWTSDNPQ